MAFTKDQANKTINDAFVKAVQKQVDEFEAQAKLAEALGTPEGAIEATLIRGVSREMADIFMEGLARSIQQDRAS